MAYRAQTEARTARPRHSRRHHRGGRCVHGHASIAEGIKWNAPSFRTTEYFATTNLRATRGIQVILHLGARVRDLPSGGITIDDPAGILKWLAKDRAVIELADTRSLKDGKAALQAILRQWIRFV